MFPNTIIDESCNLVGRANLKIKSWLGSKFQVKSEEVFLKIMRAFPFFSKGFDNKLKAYLKPISLKLSTNECIHMYDRHSFFSSPFESFLNSLEKKSKDILRNMWFHFLKIGGKTIYLDFQRISTIPMDFGS